MYCFYNGFERKKYIFLFSHPQKRLLLENRTLSIIDHRENKILSANFGKIKSLQYVFLYSHFIDSI
jgi:hypothetical protein